MLQFWFELLSKDFSVVYLFMLVLFVGVAPSLHSILGPSGCVTERSDIQKQIKCVMFYLKTQRWADNHNLCLDCKVNLAHQSNLLRARALTWFAGAFNLSFRLSICTAI